MSGAHGSPRRLSCPVLRYPPRLQMRDLCKFDLKLKPGSVSLWLLKISRDKEERGKGATTACEGAYLRRAGGESTDLWPMCTAPSLSLHTGVPMEDGIYRTQWNKAT